MTANLQKCALAKRKKKYLGFQDRQGVIQPLADKMKAIQGSQTPHNCKQLWSSLGLTNYYCQFVPHFSELAASLMEALKGWVLGVIK